MLHLSFLTCDLTRALKPGQATAKHIFKSLHNRDGKLFRPGIRYGTSKRYRFDVPYFAVVIVRHGIFSATFRINYFAEFVPT